MVGRRFEGIQMVRRMFVFCLSEHKVMHLKKIIYIMINGIYILGQKRDLIITIVMTGFVETII